MHREGGEDYSSVPLRSEDQKIEECEQATRHDNERDDVRERLCGWRHSVLTDKIWYEEEDILGIGLGGGEVHCRFCVHDLDD